MRRTQVLFKYQETEGVIWLDNLKLGYGGTKTEMERLLADAQKLSGVKYDISNLADVYEAIHVIQTEIGITGTTAKEACDCPFIPVPGYVRACQGCGAGKSLIPLYEAYLEQG